MATPVDEVLSQTRTWPREAVIELIQKLHAELEPSIAPDIEQAWKEEALNRWRDLETGAVQGVPLEEVRRQMRALLGR